ncbi:MAG: acyl-CoA dehydrogenase [Planctomycetota bacterium]
MALFWILALTALAAVILAFVGAPLIAWTVVAVAIMLFSGAPLWFWALAAVLGLVFNLPVLRQRVVSTPLAALMKRMGLLPRISETERIALEAGTVWLDGDLFSGRPDLKKLSAQPYSTDLPADEQAFLDGPVEEACRMCDDWEAHRDGDFTPELWDFLKREGFFGLIVPKKYGGHELSASGLSAVIKKLASRCFPLSVTVMIPNSLGPAELLQHYGTEEQKNEYLPKLATGEHMPCFALTEPNAGSDAGALSAEGEVFLDNDQTLKIRFNWVKRYTSLAAVSTVVGLAFKLRDPDNLLGKGENPGITCALISADAPGIVIEERHDPLGIPFYNCPMEGHDVVAPVDSIIGGADGAGRGWHMLMECLAVGRGIALPAACVATAEMTARITGSYSAVRHQFGMPVGRFEGIEEPLARILGQAYLSEAVRVLTVKGVDAGEKPSVVSAIVKYQLTELWRRVVNDGMDVMAGAGISRGPRNLLASSYEAAPIPITVEGANILTRTMIVFGQGAMRCHPFAREELEALIKGDMKAFDKALWGHVGHMVRNAGRAFTFSLTRGMLIPAPVSGPAAGAWRKLAWASASFAFIADLAMVTLGGNLKRREKLTGRLADVLSWLYIGTAVLRRFEAEGQRPEDRPVFQWAIDETFRQIQISFEGIYRNFPFPGVGLILRGPVLWWARLNSIGTGPSDEVGSKVAGICRSMSEQRDRLTAGNFRPQNEDDALLRLERAHTLGEEAAPIANKIRQASQARKLPKGRPAALLAAAENAAIVSPEEAAIYRAALAARDDAIQVDGFPLPDHLLRSPSRQANDSNNRSESRL